MFEIAAEHPYCTRIRRIAAIALRQGLTVLTQNTVDIEKVPNLSVADSTRK